jgi:hypothetical protein
VATYHINRQVLSNCLDKEVYMTKSTGNLYLPPYKRHEDALIDAVRDQWFMAERLLCYSLKFDGRISFYIIINRELGYRFSASHFVPQM